MGSVFRQILMSSGISDWQDRPADWSDIRKNCPANSIALYAAHTSDYSSYDNLGFTATATNGYDVFIDGVQYGTTYASGATCTITWSNYTATAGESITTPSVLTAHIIHIVPNDSTKNITAFSCKRVGASGQEAQGILWGHFNLKNSVYLAYGFMAPANYYNPLLTAITAKNNLLKTSNIYLAFRECSVAEYFPIFDGNNGACTIQSAFYNCSKNQSLSFSNMSITTLASCCYGCSALEEIKTKNVSITPTSCNGAFLNNYALGNLIDANYINLTDATNFITNDTNLNDTILDVSAATGLTKIGCYGSVSRVMSGFKGLRVSNQAPFNNATAPQINVSYTGMDRTALVQLFNDLPTVSNGQIINITGSVGSSNLTDEDIAIADNKGWTVVGGPAYQVYATYSGASVNDTIKINDGMATSDKEWSAYPNDTALVGNYTQTATATAVNGDIIEIATKPIQDNKTVNFKEGRIYFAYKNANNEIVYTTDKQPTTSSILYNANLESLGITPDDVKQQGLVNAEVVGGLVNNNGIFSGFSSTSYIKAKQFNFNAPWTIDMKVKTGSSFTSDAALFQACSGTGSAGRYGAVVELLNSGLGSFFCSANNSSWLFDLAGNYQYQASTDYYIRAMFDGTKYEMTHSLDGITYDSDNISYASSTQVYNNLPNTYFGIYSTTTFKDAWPGEIDLANTFVTIGGITTNFYNVKGSITINGVEYEQDDTNNIAEDIGQTAIIIDNTTIQNVTITSDQTATIETSTNITSANNNVVAQDAFNLFNFTVPTGLTAIIENDGKYYQTTDMPLTIKKGYGVGVLLKAGNNTYYRNSWILNCDIDLHYQQINFSYPSGATVSCKVNNVPQNDLTPYAYCGDIITWTCDNGGTITTGSYTVPYSSKDGNIQTITIS